MRSRPGLLARLAWRNILRQARRSTLTAAAMVVGVALLMISRAFAAGVHEEWIEAGVRLGLGHVAVQAPEYRRNPRLEHRVSAATREAVDSALAAPGVAEHVVAAAARLEIDALASSAASARPVRAIGVDPAREVGFTTLDEKSIAGRYLEPGDRLHAYIGVELAERLDLELGSRLVLSAQDAGGQITGQLVRVVGIFRTGVPETDGSLVHLPLTTAADWLGTNAGVTTVAVLLDSSREVASVRRSLERSLAAEIAAGRAVVLSWREAMPELEAGIRLDDYGDYLFHIILFAIIALAIVNTILMSVLYRQREFGVLQALGLSPARTGALVVLEGLMLTTASGVLGVVLGLSVTWLFWRDGLDLSFLWSSDMTAAGVVIEPILYPVFRLTQVAVGFAFIAVIGTLASLYPAYRATRIEVAEAMKFER